MEKTPMNTFAIKKLITPTTSNGPIGEFTSLNSGNHLIIKKATRTLAEIMTPLPRRLMSDPTPEVMKKAAAFLRARTKAASAEEQKFSPVSATWM